MARRTPVAAPRADVTMLAEVRAGLHAVQTKLPSKYLYDEHGSALVEPIRERPEYYLDRAERAILADWGADTEMHLLSTARQAVTIPGVGVIDLEEGETK